MFKKWAFIGLLNTLLAKKNLEWSYIFGVSAMLPAHTIDNITLK